MLTWAHGKWARISISNHFLYFLFSQLKSYIFKTLNRLCSEKLVITNALHAPVFLYKTEAKDIEYERGYDIF